MWGGRRGVLIVGHCYGCLSGTGREDDGQEADVGVQANLLLAVRTVV